MTTSDSSRLMDSMDAYDTNNEKVGNVDDMYDVSTGVASSTTTSTSNDGYLWVPIGFLGLRLGSERHIPFSAISRVDDDKIYLRVPKEQLDELGYAEEPTRYAATDCAALLHAEPGLSTERTIPAAPQR